MIRIEELIKKYENNYTLHLDDLEIIENEIFGLVGNNGAGKTTFLRLLLNLIEPTQGSITINDIDIFTSEEIKINGYIGAYLDDKFLIPYLTANEYLQIIAKLYKIKSQELQKRIEILSPFFDNGLLNEDKLIRELSTGNKNKVGIISALIPFPKIVILDEPFANLDPSSQFQLKNIIVDLHEIHNTTIIISSHNLDHVSEICNRIVILEDGKIIKDLPRNENTVTELEKYFYKEKQES